MSEWTAVLLDDNGNEVSERVTLEPRGDDTWRMTANLVAAIPTQGHVVRVEGDGRAFILPVGLRTRESQLGPHLVGIPVEVVDYSILEA